MPTTRAISRRDGTTAENNLLTGVQSEITVDTDLNNLRVHDGATAGGFTIPNVGDVAASITAAVDPVAASAAKGEALASEFVVTNAPFPTFVDANNVEYFGFNSQGQMIASMSPGVLTDIAGSSEVATAISTQVAAIDVSAIIPDLSNSIADTPSIVDAQNVELLGFDRADGSAVVPGLRLPNASLKNNALTATPGFFDGSMTELLGFDPQGRARFVVSPDVAKQVQLLNTDSTATATTSLPDTDIDCYGDSMTDGALGGGTTITTVLAAELGRTVGNYGVGGTESSSIAIRQGGRAFPITLTGSVIPAVPADLDISDYGGEDAYNNQTSQTRTGTLAGVPGTLTRVATAADATVTEKYTFRRSATGSEAVVVPTQTPFIFDTAIASRDKTQIIWAGRNNPKSTRADFVAIRDDVLSMVEFLSPLHKRFLVVSICNGGEAEGTGTGSYNGIAEANRELAEYFGHNYVDLRSYMVRRAIYDAGITPTAQDILDMNADGIPQSLRGDTIHFNATGYTQAGLFLARQIIARGY